jgi:ATP-dependent DNA helicase RecQ
LLSGKEDSEITNYFIESAFPTRKEAEEVLGALEREPLGLSTYGLMSRVNLSAGRIQKTIDLLSLESSQSQEQSGS